MKRKMHKLEARCAEREYHALLAIAQRDHAGNPSEALRAVVREAAQARGLWDEVGRVRAGKEQATCAKAA